MGVEEVARKAFEPLAERVLGVLLWGSHVRADAHARSDVDVCIVAGPDLSPIDALALAWREVDPHGMELDVKCFEALPRFLQGAVIERHRVLCAHDEPALYEYLFPFRRLWEDEAHRQRLTENEARALVEG